MQQFKFVDRGFAGTAVLLHGWAADHRIFDILDIDYNYIVPTRLSYANFKEAFESAIKGHGLKRVILFGWSAGGFLAAELASSHPDKISQVILVGLRKRYEKAGLDAIRSYLAKNRRAYLRSFYSGCFSEDEKAENAWFKKTLLKPYLEEMDSKTLLEGLDYLSRAEIVPEGLRGVKVSVIHGSDDRIAPPDEALKLKDCLPEARFAVMEKAGHMPFLRPDFRKIFHAAVR